MYTESPQMCLVKPFYKGVGFQVIVHSTGSFYALKSRNNHVLYRDQGTILSPLSTMVASPKLDFWVTFSVLVVYDSGT